MAGEEPVNGLMVLPVTWWWARSIGYHRYRPIDKLAIATGGHQSTVPSNSRLHGLSITQREKELDGQQCMWLIHRQ